MKACVSRVGYLLAENIWAKNIWQYSFVGLKSFTYDKTHNIILIIMMIERSYTFDIYFTFHTFYTVLVYTFIKLKMSTKNPTVVHPTTTMNKISEDEEKALMIRRQSESAKKHHHAKTKRKEKEAEARVQKRLELRKRAKRAGALGKCPSFATLSKEGQSRIVDMMEYKKISGGKVLCEEGDVADRMYLLMKGACSVTIGEQQVAILAGGDYPVFGESALFDDDADAISLKFKKKKAATRTATVTAIDELQVLVLKRSGLRALVKSGDLDAGCVKALETVAVERRKANALSNARTGTVDSISSDRDEVSGTPASMAVAVGAFAVLTDDKTCASWAAEFHANPNALQGLKKLMDFLQSDETKETTSRIVVEQRQRPVQQPAQLPKYNPLERKTKAAVTGATTTGPVPRSNRDLVAACEKGDVEMVKTLLAKEGVQVNERDRGVSALYVACLDGHVEVVRLLLGVEGIDVNSADKNGATCLYQACNLGHLEVVRVLLEMELLEIGKGLDEFCSYTPLKIAEERGYKEIVSLLVAVVAGDSEELELH